MATAAELAAGKYDKVVVASGVSPRLPGLPGIECSLVVLYTEVLSGRVLAGKRSRHHGWRRNSLRHGAIPSGGRQPKPFGRGSLRGPAGALNEQPATNNHVTTSPWCSGLRAAWERNLGKTTGWIHREVLRQAGVRQLTGATYEHVDDRGLSITIDGESRFVEADTIIICAGQTPENSLFGELQESGVQTYLIGGAKEATGLDAERAIDEGTRLAARL